MKKSSLNCAYRLVWSEIHNAYIVVSEIAKGRGKKSSAAVSLVTSAALLFGGQVAAQQAPPLGSLLSVVPKSAPAIAPSTLPSGATVVAGAAGFVQTDNSLTVNQATDKLITHWNTFNIGADASVRFNQPNASSIALNRVLSNDPSAIYGVCACLNLTHRAQLFLTRF